MFSFLSFIHFPNLCILTEGLLHSSVGKEFACNARDPGLIPGSGRSTGEGIGYSAGRESACSTGDLGSIPELGRSPLEEKGYYALQYSGLENSMDCMVHRVTKSLTGLNKLQTLVNNTSVLVH